MVTGLDKALLSIVTSNGWVAGTSLENKVSLRLSHLRFDPRCIEQQFSVGGYRLDFAWPALMIGLEADGWWHRSPEGAAKDSERDSTLRSIGWVIFRVDDRHGDESLDDQVLRFAHIIRTLEGDLSSWGSRQSNE